MINYMSLILLYSNFAVSILIFILTTVKSKRFNTLYFTRLSLIMIFIALGAIIFTSAPDEDVFIIGFKIYGAGICLFPVSWYFLVCDLFCEKKVTKKKNIRHTIVPLIFIAIFIIISFKPYVGENDIITFYQYKNYNSFHIGNYLVRNILYIYISVYILMALQTLIKNYKRFDKVGKKILNIFLVVNILCIANYFVLFFSDRQELEVVMYTIIQALLVYAVFGKKILNRNALDSDNTINSLDEIYMLIDYKKRVIDSNIMAEKFFDFDSSNLPKKVEDIKNFPYVFLDSEEKAKEIEIIEDDKILSYRMTKYSEKKYIIFIMYNITKVKELEKSYENKLLYDNLTGLYNRRVFYGKVNKMEIIKHSAVILLDVDNFRKINTIYGEAVGDKMLKNISDVLKNCIGKNNIVCRYSGTKFCIVYFFENKEDINHLPKKIFKELEEYEFKHNNEILNITVSMGVSVLNENSFEALYECINNSSDNLIKAKNSGKNKFIVEEVML